MPHHEFMPRCGIISCFWANENTLKVQTDCIEKSEMRTLQHSTYGRWWKHLPKIGNHLSRGIKIHAATQEQKRNRPPFVSFIYISHIFLASPFLPVPQNWLHWAQGPLPPPLITPALYCLWSSYPTSHHTPHLSSYPHLSSHLPPLITPQPLIRSALYCLYSSFPSPHLSSYNSPTPLATFNQACKSIASLDLYNQVMCMFIMCMMYW